MYKILDLKRVFSIFQEIVSSLRKHGASANSPSKMHWSFKTRQVNATRNMSLKALSFPSVFTKSDSK